MYGVRVPRSRDCHQRQEDTTMSKRRSQMGARDRDQAARARRSKELAAKKQARTPLPMKEGPYDRIRRLIDEDNDRKK
jgi:hypothetical protein